MIYIDHNIYVGDSDDEQEADIKAILNVAKDLAPTRNFPQVDYMHVGLVDGPGNTVELYVTATLALISLLQRNDKVMICCHSMTRSVVIAAIYLNVKEGRVQPVSVFLPHWTPWKERISKTIKSVKGSFPIPHKAHGEMFDKIPFGIIKSMEDYNEEDNTNHTS